MACYGDSFTYLSFVFSSTKKVLSLTTLPLVDTVVTVPLTHLRAMSHQTTSNGMMISE
jgi:hypothetical protein